jgi:hypothetical protein
MVDNDKHWYDGMPWLKKYCDERDTLDYSHTLILADILQELIKEIRTFRQELINNGM